MENALHMIVETDKASRQKVEQAYARREQLTEELSAKKQEIDAQYKEQAQQVLAKKRAEAQEQLENAKAQRAQKDAQISTHLQETYAQQHAAWETEIFEAVVSQ